MFDYLDGPPAWETGRLCIDDGASSNVTISSGHVHSDVDMIKAVIWWYDHRHDGGLVEADKVRLSLQSYNSGTSSWTTHRISNTDDHTQRVYFEGPTNGAVRLRIIGRDITSDLDVRRPGPRHRNRPRRSDPTGAMT